MSYRHPHSSSSQGYRGAQNHYQTRIDGRRRDDSAINHIDRQTGRYDRTRGHSNLVWRKNRKGPPSDLQRDSHVNFTRRNNNNHNYRNYGSRQNGYGFRKPETDYESLPKKVPKHWLGCPTHGSVIAGIFVAVKSPLSSQCNVLQRNEVWTPEMLVETCKTYQKPLGLVIDLSLPVRYNPDVLRKLGIDFVKIPCASPATLGQIKKFIGTCERFLSSSPGRLIAVHCTHGYNRTGSAICSYLCEKLGYSVENSLKLFSEKRSPGIYRQEAIDSLIERYSRGRLKPGDIQAIGQPRWEINYD